MDRVHTLLRGRAEDTLKKMLAFEPKDRPSAKECDEAWTAISRQAGGAEHSHETAVGKWARILQHLMAIERKEFDLTDKQFSRLVSEYEQSKRAAKGSPEQTVSAELESVLGRLRKTRNLESSAAE